MNTKKNVQKIASIVTAALLTGTLASANPSEISAAGMYEFSTLGSGAELRTELLQQNSTDALNFNITALSKYGDQKCGEGKCGEGKCGEKGKTEKKTPEAKTPEAKCGEGKCGEKGKTEKKNTEAKTPEAKCGEGKCGEKK